MKAHDSRDTFEALLKQDGHSVNELTAPQGVSALIKFYRQHRAEDSQPDSDSDMLLFQWGTTTLDGNEVFQLDLTRQLIPGDDAEDEDIWQLSLNFAFAVSEAPRALTPGNKWCRRPRPQAVDHFENFIRSSDAYRGVSELQPLRVKLDYFNAG